MAPDDRELVERARAGDETAFDALCRRHEEAVRRHLYRKLPARLRKRISAADVAQETLATALERLRELDAPFEGSFRGWLLKIAAFKAKETARFHLDTAKRAAGNELSSPHRPITEALRLSPTTPSGQAVEAESQALIDAHLAALPDHYRVILQLVYVQGMPIADAARSLGSSPDAARKLHARAIAALAKHMKENAGSDDGHI